MVLDYPALMVLNWMQCVRRSVARHCMCEVNAMAQRIKSIAGHRSPDYLDTHRSSDNGVTRVWIEADGRTIGSATVSREGTTITMVFAMAHGHVPVAGRSRLVNVVFGLPEVQAKRRVQVALPIGDPDLLAGVRAHVDDPRVHAAGATCLIEAMAR